MTPDTLADTTPTDTPAAPTDAAPKPSIDWSRVEPEDIPRQLLDKHPLVRELVSTRQQLANDLRLAHKAYARAANLGSAIHTVIQGLEDTDQLLNGSLSPIGRSIVNPNQPTPAKR